MKVIHKPSTPSIIQRLNRNDNGHFFLESRLNNHNNFDLPTSEDLSIEQDYADMKFQLLINDLIDKR